jgi:hypothetical protein
VAELEPGDDEDENSRSSSETDDAVDSDSIDDEFSNDADDASDLEDDEDEDEVDAFGAGRELCPDETCVGIVNAQGVCGECGRTSSAAPSAAPSAKLAKSRGDSNPGEAVDLMHRSLCPDGSCIGLLGPDGRCKECGLVGESVYTDPRLRGLKTPAIEDAPDAQEAPLAPDAPILAPAEDGDAEGDEDEGAGEFGNRRLCPDGACIGIIGPAGTCNECGTVL